MHYDSKGATQSWVFQSSCFNISGRASFSYPTSTAVTTTISSDSSPTMLNVIVPSFAISLSELKSVPPTNTRALIPTFLIQFYGKLLPWRYQNSKNV